MMKRLKFTVVFLVVLLLAGSLFGQTARPGRRPRWDRLVDWILNGQETFQYKTLTNLGNVTFANGATIVNTSASLLTLTEAEVNIAGKLSATLTTEQFRLSYDATNYLTMTLADDGHTSIVTVDPDGAEADININPDGNVGIKTAAPATALEVTGAIRALKTTEQFRLAYDATNYAAWTVAADGALTLVTVDASAAEGDINFNPDGLVGIKTAVPSTELDVTGTITASTGYALGDGDYVGVTDNERLTFATAGTIAAVGADFDVGTTSADDVQPAITIRGDADSDAAGDTDEALTIDLTPNATPTSAVWDITSTQSAGYRFDKNMTVGIATPDETLPYLAIRGDADSDAAGDTTDELKVILTANATPTSATWNITSTQSAGYVFDKTIETGGSLILEGSTADGNETTVSVEDPTADRTHTLPDYTGGVPIVIGQSSTQTALTATGTTDVTGSSLTIADGWFTAGKAIRWTLWGTMPADNDRLQVHLYIDDAQIVSLATTDAAGCQGDWVAVFTMIEHTDTANQDCTGELWSVGDAGVHALDYVTDTTDFNDGGTTTVKCQIQSEHDDDDATVEYVLIEHWVK
jgi:hypothetical protein